MITVINKPSNRFTIVSNTIVRDKRLSCGAKGVALIILHFPEDIVPTLDLLRYISPSDGRDKLRGYLQELEECKYLKRDTKRGTNGKFEGAEWVFDSDPTPVEPSTGEPEPGNPTSAETTIDNTNLSNTSGAKTRKDKTLDASASSAAPEKATPKKKEPKFKRTDRPEIPFQEIALHFKNKHEQFRKTKAFYLPYKEDPKLVELWDILGSKEKVYEAVEAFIGYIKNVKSKDGYMKHNPIMPSQMLGVLNFTLDYWPSQSSRPKLEIKQYEQKGIAIGPMPEGW